MKNILNQVKLEKQIAVDLIQGELPNELINSIDLPLHFIDIEKNVVAIDSRCNHSGRCGSSNHKGNGYCHWCKICNPSNPRAY